MAICSFYLRGQCKFGSSCRNEHPANVQPTTGGGAFGSLTWNRGDSKFTLFTQDSLRDDMTKEKPMWPLSSYGPAKYEPTIVKDLDQSPEELRVKATMAKASGTSNEYATSQIAAAEATIADVRNNIPRLYNEARKSTNVAPAPSNNSAFGNTSTSTSAFGTAGSTTTSVFGTPAFGGSSNSVFGGQTNTTPSVFGTPAATSAFGATSNSSTTPASVFGTPSNAATTTPSAFGTPSNTTSAFGNTTTTPAFGKPAFGSTATTTPSAFGKPAFGQPAFGQSAFSQATTTPTSNPPTTSAFGQSAFGQTSTTPASSTTTTTSAFGQPAFGQTATPAAGQGGAPLIKQPTGFGAFANAGPSAFGTGAPATTTPAAASSPGSTQGGGGFSAFASSQPTSFASAISNAGGTGGGGGSVFGQPSAFGTPSAPSAFGGGNTTTTSSAFGAPQNTSASAFGNPQNPSGSVFGQPQQNTGAFSGGGTTNTGGSVFGQPSQPQAGLFSAFRQNISGASPISSSSSMATSTPGGYKALDFDQAVYNYRPGLAPQDSRLPPNYTQLLPEAAMAAFKAAKFEWGKVPQFVPPVEVRVKHVSQAVFS